MHRHGADTPEPLHNAVRRCPKTIRDHGHSDHCDLIQPNSHRFDDLPVHRRITGRLLLHGVNNFDEDTSVVQMPGNREPVDLTSLVDAAIQDVLPSAQAKEIRVERQVPAGATMPVQELAR